MSTNWIDLPPHGGGGGGAVDSVFGRTGTVSAAAGDYTASLITNVPSGNISAINVQAAINQLDSGKEPTITVLPISKGGTGASSFTTGSIPFMGATTFTEDNDNLAWDVINSQLLIGDQAQISSDIQGSLRAIHLVTDPGSANTVGIVSLVDSTYTATAAGGVLGAEIFARASVAAGQSIGALGGVFVPVSRISNTDDGDVSFAAGVVASLTQGNSALKHTDSFSTFLSAFHSIDSNANQIGDMYDFHAMSSGIGAGAVTNRYGVFIEPDSGYTKRNWLSGNTQMGGTSFSDPATTLQVAGNFYAAITNTDLPAIGAEIHANTSTTIDGSNNTVALQLSAAATVDAGATNDKVTGGMVSTITRGNGTDDGELDAITGVTSLIFHQAGPAGVTRDAFGYSSIFITQSGTITNLYDFFSQRAPAGGDVTNHYGIYISYDSATPVQNWLSGNTQLGGSSFSAPVKALEVQGDASATGDIAAATLTPANGASGTFLTADAQTVTVINGIITSIV